MRIPRGRWLWAAALVAAVVTVLVLGSRQTGALEQRIARYRAAGQPTTSAELDAFYTAVPPAENAAPPLLEAIGTWRSIADTNLPGSTTAYPRRGAPWPDPMLAALRAELAANASALAGIHTALARPKNRYLVDLKRGVNFTAPHLNQIKPVVQKLASEARFAAETSDPARATTALLASLRAARTLEEEPLLISYLVRIAGNAIAMGASEDVLSRIGIDEGQLDGLQQAFALAESPGHLSRAFIGERCLMWSAIKTPGALLGASPGASANNQRALEKVVLAAAAQLYEVSGLKRRDMGFYFDRIDELIEAGERPREEMPARNEHFDAELARLARPRLGISLRPISRMTLPAFSHVLGKEMRSVATLRCARTAMAIERWRVAHADTLPASLDALVPRYLTAVPIDPMDGKPVKFRPLAKGYVVYSIGEDGHDDGGLEFGQRPKDKSGNAVPPGRFDYTFTVGR